MRIGSLCSGYGGIDLAAEEFFGATTAWHCEWESAPSKILAHHWNVPNHHDLTTTDWDAVEPVDILTGGYPCQPFSSAGQRKGADDERHLWPYVRQAIRRLRPRLALLENVAGHRSLGFDRVLGDCAEDGLSVRWVSLRASDVGAPHGRERIFFIVAHSRSVQPERWGGHEDVAGSSSSRERADRQWQRYGDAIDYCGPAPADAESIGRTEGRTEPARLIRRSDVAISGGATPADSDGGQRDGRQQGAQRGQVGRTATAGGGAVDWGVYGPAIRRWEHVLGRPAPAPTEPGRNGPRLSPLLVEWMMGLPAGWVTSPEIGLTRNEQLKALGNGVVPQQATEALRRLVPMAAAA